MRRQYNNLCMSEMLFYVHKADWWNRCPCCLVLMQKRSNFHKKTSCANSTEEQNPSSYAAVISVVTLFTLICRSQFLWHHPFLSPWADPRGALALTIRWCVCWIPPPPPTFSNVHRGDSAWNEACVFISYLSMQQQCYIKVAAVMVYIKCIQNTLMITSEVSSGLEIA